MVGVEDGDLSPMSKQDEYRSNALETYELAKRVSTSGDKRRLLRLAEKWLDLAERVHRVTKPAKRSVGEHPLVVDLLGNDAE